MKFENFAILVFAVALSGLAQASAFFGAGAAFPKPVYLAWGNAYKAEGGGVLVYTTVGSGKGQAEIKAARTDFGASDMPLTSAELDQEGLMQFPTVIGGVVPVINLKDIGGGQLRLDGATLAAIYMGKITRWNDPALITLNPGLSLPNQVINVIHRTDKSGATFYLTNYLSKVSNEWKDAKGEGLTVAFDEGIGVDSSANMAQRVATTPNSLGYVDYVLLKKTGLTSVKLKNAEGEYTAASDNAFASAASAAKWTAANGFYEVLTNEPGKASWPITSSTFVLVERTPRVADNIIEAFKFFDWSYRKGRQIATDLGYVPLPDSVVDLVRNAWKTQVKSRTGQVLWQ